MNYEERMEAHKNRVNYNNADFYLEFNKAKLNKFEHLGKKRSEQKISQRTYDQIIRTFLTIYFYEVFYLDKIHYFFLGGELIRARVSKFVNFKNEQINEAPTLIWYKRPLHFYFNNFRLGLMRGERNTMEAIRANFMKTQKLHALPLVKDKSQQFLKEKIFVVQTEKI